MKDGSSSISSSRAREYPRNCILLLAKHRAVGVNDYLFSKSFQIYNAGHVILQNKLLLLKTELLPCRAKLPGQADGAHERLPEFRFRKRLDQKCITLHIAVRRQLLPGQRRFKQNGGIPVGFQRPKLSRQVRPLVIGQLYI